MDRACHARHTVAGAVTSVALKGYANESECNLKDYKKICCEVKKIQIVCAARSGWKIEICKERIGWQGSLRRLLFLWDGGFESAGN
jgi:hypothetical protein